ncbi:MAG: LON peptidase substrate-binding domain-containing protein [Proteobacteria bacterium]|nr:LON peptidase substrate-binding domain-containing protein [Pseudomonadota bacterium]
MPSNVQYAATTDLPETLPLFPLPGALLLPRGLIPLNIFEPRYVEMFDAALAGGRLIGMIQPRHNQGRTSAAPELYPVGCAGRITQFAETGDGRYLVQLTGIARFKLVEEMPGMMPYRQASVDFTPYAHDLSARLGEDEVDRGAVIAALRNYSEANEIPIDWKNVGEAANEALVNALSMLAPFGPAEKQALLEAHDLKARAEMLVALTELDLAREEGDGGPKMQ